MVTRKLKILIVDDNKSFRDAAREFLKNEYNYDIVAEASNGLEFLELIKCNEVDVVLMDIQMPELDGMSATKEWCFYNTRTNVIALTMFTEKAYLEQLILAGFKGCVFKTNFFEEIKNAIEKVNGGGFYFNSNMPVA
jgi:DNA-binding NarL/FixJ family response regulator